MIVTLLAGASVAQAAERFPDGRLPPVDAPASAYGSDIRPGSDGRPNADDLAGIAERQRQQGHPILALQLAERVLDYAPDNAQARRTQISSLSNLGAYARANRLRERFQPDWPAATQARFDADVTTAAIRHGVQEQARQERRQRYAVRQRALQATLAELNANLAGFAPDSDAARRTRFDRLVVLDRLDLHAQAIADYESLMGDGVEVPAYAQAAVADAYLARRHPEQAATLYRQVIEAQTTPSLEIRTGYYYALIESEQYDRAAKLLADIDSSTPAWRSRANPKTPPVPNWERSEVDRLQILDATYRNHESEALARAERMQTHAPRNTDAINALATAQRARGWYDRAQLTTELAAAYAPRDRSARLNMAENAQDREDFPLWQAMIEPLAAQFPNDSAVRRNHLEWQDRDHFSLEGQGTFGRSRGGDAVNGSRDYQYRLRLNSPWFAGSYRVFAEQLTQWSAYDEGAERENRQGFGIERQWRRMHWWAAVSGDRLQDDVGLELGWSQWLNDRWQYQLRTQTESPETPLRAEGQDLDGQLYQAQLTWRQNESRQATLTLGALDISDGNLRSDLSADLTQRVQASAHHQTRLIGSLSAEHNSQPETAYYNPENLRSAGVALEHDWLTWRRYNHALTQNFSLGAADEWEQGYGSATGLDATYGHTWQLTRTWSLNYGVGWGSHDYEGEREKRWFGQLGFEGVL
ncbi:poly-beta-1,6 N-acetyl-D-glucosamine export porin PgaA [Salinicola rhizosphaerae]|uniref:Poly-beta-1,6 N-acetyl-D-glucosamine export porin PgaA n=1 Tax=Salinicola rhizosphaerae TaxID=1443141 RepID=A0ABQ3ECW9_9GAMM|nr:poly-beta-1,6 N-acetyl-D-glucosamine export porin PgaA [Salinicola rhizosphaerae]